MSDSHIKRFERFLIVLRSTRSLTHHQENETLHCRSVTLLQRWIKVLIQPSNFKVSKLLSHFQHAPIIQNVINSDNLNEISEPDSEAFSIFLDTFFKELNVSSESATSKFSDIFFATLNETLEKVPKEDGDKFSSLLFANLPNEA